MSIRRLDSVSRRTCWVCYAAEEDEPNWQWVHPCRCRGSTKWVHVQCLQTWIDAKQKGNTFQPVRCPQCRVHYVIIYPRYGVIMSLLVKYEALTVRFSPLVCAGAVLGSIYWSLFTYGAVTIMQIYGWQEGLDLVEGMDVRILLFGLPIIPIGLIFLKLIRWEHYVLSFLNRYLLPSIPSPSLRAAIDASPRSSSRNVETGARTVVPPITTAVSRGFDQHTDERFNYLPGPGSQQQGIPSSYADVTAGNHNVSTCDPSFASLATPSETVNDLPDNFASTTAPGPAGPHELADGCNTKSNDLQSVDAVEGRDANSNAGEADLTDGAAGVDENSDNLSEVGDVLDFDGEANDDGNGNEGNNGDGLGMNFELIVERGSRSLTRVLAGALSLPSIANLIGRFYFAQIENPLVRTIAGGLVFIGIKGVFTMYYRRNQMIRIASRQIKHFPDEAEVGIQTDFPSSVI